MSPSLSTPPGSEAEQIALLTRELAWSRLKIQSLEEQLRLEMIRKYGPKSEKLSDAQLQLLELEPGVSAEEVEGESNREPLPLASPVTAKARAIGRHPGASATTGRSASRGKNHCLDAGTMHLRELRQRYGSDRLRAERTTGYGARAVLRDGH